MRRLWKDLRGNPIAMREAGLDFCPRRLGLRGGQWRLVLVGAMWLVCIAGTMYFARKTSTHAAVRLEHMTTPLTMVLCIVFLTMVAATMASAMRAFSRNETDHLEELLVTPLTPRDIVQAKVLSRGFPAFSAMFLLWAGALTILLLAIYFGFSSDESPIRMDMELIPRVPVFLVGGMIIVELYLRGCLASLRTGSTVFRAILSYGATFFVFIVLFGMVLLNEIYVQELLTGSRNTQKETEEVFQLATNVFLFGIVGFAWFRCRALYEQLAEQLQGMLLARLEQGTAG